MCSSMVSLNQRRVLFVGFWCNVKGAQFAISCGFKKIAYIVIKKIPTNAKCSPSVLAGFRDSLSRRRNLTKSSICIP